MSPEDIWFGVSLVVSSVGLLGMVVCRIGEKSGRCSLCQGIFLLAMLLVAASTLVSLALQSSHWVLSGATLATMAVGATVQTGQTPISEAGR